MTQISEERAKYHELLPVFKRLIKPGGSIYDIGKSHLHDYRKTFEEYKYCTIDRDASKKPDLLLDVETVRQKQYVIEQANGLLCNGVVEQCDDPMEIIKVCNLMVQKDGHALFGMVLLGYPPHTYDRFRFTKTGAQAALARYGFTEEQGIVIERNGVPSYIYALCRKTREIL